jgi:hypothetical protein
MFAQCCCTDSVDPQQTISYAPTEEKAPVAVATTSVLSSDPALNRPPPEVTAPRQTEEALPPNSDRSLSPEEKEAEKQRLQQLVNSFAKKAVKGCSCMYLKESTGEQCRTQYRIDKTLEYLIIVSSEDATKAEVTCPIASIQDIYSYVEDGENCFPVEVTSRLSPEQKQYLLMVVYRSGNSKMFRFCLLEESAGSRDVFLECLRVLCIYAQSNAQADGNTPPAVAG